MGIDFIVHLPRPHPKQAPFLDSPAKRKIIRAGRRGGKTVGVAILAVKAFLAGHRVLYASPTAEQIGRFWTEVVRALQEPIDAGIFYKNETEHIIELSGTEQRIRAKTAWNADTLRGDYADTLILDEWQLMNEDTWGIVGAPMLLDNNGDAVFVYTPPSLHSRSVTKANDPQHAAKMFKKAALDTSGAWATFSFTSHDNPHISKVALEGITQDMTNVAYRMEILAEDIDEVPGALWKRANLDEQRVTKHPALRRIVVAVDPTGTKMGDMAGIVVAGVADVQTQTGKVEHLYVLEDASRHGSPLEWATAAVTAYHKYSADRIVAESNFGGEMVESTIRQVERNVPYRAVPASRSKQVRAEPVAAIYEQGRGHHVGVFAALEDELCGWEPGQPSPNRMDALVWAATDLLAPSLGADSDVTLAEAFGWRG